MADVIFPQDRDRTFDAHADPLTEAVNRLRHCEISLELHVKQLATAKSKLREARADVAKLLGIRSRAKVGK